MNSNRKADIQRRLALASVPKPPEGLADRIKADIPKYLKATGNDRQRHSRSISLNLRVAASFLLLISAVFTAVQLMSPEEEMQSMKTVATATYSPASPSLPELQRAIAAAPQEEVRVEIAEEAAASVAMTRTGETDGAPVLAHAAPPRARRDMPTVEEAERAIQNAEVGVTGNLVGRVAEAAPPPAQMADVAGVTPTFPAAAPAPQAARREAAATAAFSKEAKAADSVAASGDTIFGISVDPAVFHRIKATLEQGERPSADSVNIAALVNYFAGAPARKPRRDVTLEVEGSPVPVGVEGRRGMVRFTIDTPAAKVVAKNATIEIDINHAAVTTFRPIGVDPAAAAEDALPGSTSITGLYEVELRPGISARERVATVTLRYHSVNENRERVIRKELRGRDFAGAWTAASRRHRLASLGAVWGETLKGAASEAEVARRAEELATQSPDDSRARELSRLAAVSSRMRGTPGTGSGG